jgi:hypothetical protein
MMNVQWAGIGGGREATQCQPAGKEVAAEGRQCIGTPGGKEEAKKV